MLQLMLRTPFTDLACEAIRKQRDDTLVVVIARAVRVKHTFVRVRQHITAIRLLKQLRKAACAKDG